MLSSKLEILSPLEVDRQSIFYSWSLYILLCLLFSETEKKYVKLFLISVLRSFRFSVQQQHTYLQNFVSLFYTRESLLHLDHRYFYLHGNLKHVSKLPCTPPMYKIFTWRIIRTWMFLSWKFLHLRYANSQC